MNFDDSLYQWILSDSVVLIPTLLRYIKYYFKKEFIYFKKEVFKDVIIDLLISYNSCI